MGSFWSLNKKASSEGLAQQVTSAHELQESLSESDKSLPTDCRRNRRKKNIAESDINSDLHEDTRLFD